MPYGDDDSEGHGGVGGVQHAQFTARVVPSVLILIALEAVRPRVIEEKGET